MLELMEAEFLEGLESSDHLNSILLMQVRSGDGDRVSLDINSRKRVQGLNEKQIETLSRGGCPLFLPQKPLNEFSAGRAYFDETTVAIGRHLQLARSWALRGHGKEIAVVFGLSEKDVYFLKIAKASDLDNIAKHIRFKLKSSGVFCYMPGGEGRGIPDISWLGPVCS